MEKRRIRVNLMSMYVMTPIILIFLSFWGIILKKKNIMFINFAFTYVAPHLTIVNRNNLR